MNLITWNINRFNGVWDWYRTGYDMGKRGRIKNHIITKLKNYICTKDDIAILQEIPYTELDEIKNLFEKKDLQIKTWYIEEKEKKDFPVSPKNITIAVVTKGSNWKLIPWDEKNIDFGKDPKRSGRYNYVNKYVEVINKKLGNIKLFGGHFNEDMWKSFENSMKKIHDKDKFRYILGDFNYNEEKYKKCSNILNIYNFIRGPKQEPKYKQLIEGDIITCNKCATSVDNIFVEEKFSKNVNINVKVIDYTYINDRKKCNMRFSDHNMCLASLEDTGKKNN